MKLGVWYSTDMDDREVISIAHFWDVEHVPDYSGGEGERVATIYDMSEASYELACAMVKAYNASLEDNNNGF
jgi:hypothetical protein